MKLYTFGCSFTEGQELENPVEECYSNKIANIINKKHFNFGSTGASNDYIFRKVFELINKHIISNDDIIVIQWTHYNRKELPIVHNNKNYYCYIPNSYNIYTDKEITRQAKEVSVKSSYTNENLKYENFSEFEKQMEEPMKNFILNFLHEEYQINNTINYINSLYTYLEYYNYKHLHFFGWDECKLPKVFENGNKFLTETFGGYTNTNVYKHPNKLAHEKWAEFLYEKLNKEYKEIVLSEKNKLI